MKSFVYKESLKLAIRCFFYASLNLKRGVLFPEFLSFENYDRPSYEEKLFRTLEFLQSNVPEEKKVSLRDMQETKSRLSKVAASRF